MFSAINRRNQADRPPGGLNGGLGLRRLENDDATDWLAQLGTIAPDDPTKIFGQTADDTTYFEAPAASVVESAAEVVAALNGSPRQVSSTRNCEMDDESRGANSGIKSSAASSLGSSSEKR